MSVEVHGFEDGTGGFAACTHSEDYCGSATDGIASGKDEWARGAAFAVGHNASPGMAVEARGGGADKGVGRGAEGGYDGVGLQFKFASSHGREAAASALVGLAESHADAAQGLHSAIGSG